MALLMATLPERARSAQKVEPVPISGERYVSIKGWAESKGFSFAWDKPAKTVSVTNRWGTLLFQVNSKKASINGLTVWLSSSVLPNGSGVFVADRDLQKLIVPILYPEKLPASKRIKTIAVAAGHGGKDPGYQINRQQEKKYTLLMAQALKDALVAAGFKVIMTRDTDVFIDLDEQAAKANRARADLFITLHYNAAAEVDAKGLETYCLTPTGAISTNGGSPMSRSPGHKQDSLNALLAYQLHRSLTQNAGLEDRGIRRAGFVVLRNITMPGVLIEGGFLSNPRDAEKICSANDRKRTAHAMVDGVLSFKRLVERK